MCVVWVCVREAGRKRIAGGGLEGGVERERERERTETHQ